MSWSYKIDKHKGLVSGVISGVLTARDVLAFRQHLVMDRDFDPRFRLLADFSKATKVDLFPDELRILAAMNPFLPTSRRAFVVPAKAPNADLLKVFALFDATRRFSAKGAVQLFTDRKKALDWLFPKRKPTNDSARGASPPIRHPAVRSGSPGKHALSSGHS